MISMLDTFLEKPVDNPLANKPLLEFFPSYAPTQFAAAGAFHHQALVTMIGLSLAWTAAFALVGRQGPKVQARRRWCPQGWKRTAPPAGVDPADRRLAADGGRQESDRWF